MNSEIRYFEVREPSGWYDAPNKEHQDSCTCVKCHEIHLENDEIFDNCKTGLGQFQCCKDARDEWEAKQEICNEHEKHRDEDGLCNGCEKGEAL